MLEEHVAFYLEKYLGNYVKGLSKEALKISVWQGNVELTNMQLKPEALNALKLPIKVKAGFLGSVKLKVPWSRLGKEPVIVFLDRIFILAEPATKVEGGSDDAAIQQAKNHKVKDAEISMVEARHEDVDKSGMNNSWLGSLINTIIGNLKLSITNIHIRYEDIESNSGHPFAAGLTLKKLLAITVDENGNETFVTGRALDHIQKAGELEGLALYFNSDTKPWELDKNLEDFLPREWSKVFEPGIKALLSDNWSDAPFATHDFQYLLQPVSASARYRRCGAGVAKTAEKEQQRATFFLDNVTLSLSQNQYRDVLKLIENFNTFNKRLQYAHYRPVSPVKNDVKSWWKYACKVITDQQKKARGHLSWSQIMRYTKLRKRYLEVYVNCLRSNPNLVSIDDNKEIQELDRELDVDVIIQWRMLAHMVAGYNRSRYDGKRQQTRGWWWFSWGNESDENEPKNLNNEDWTRLNQIIGYQEGTESTSIPEGSSSMLHTVIEVRMRSNATKLLDDKGLELIQLSCENLASILKVYQEMKIFDLTLGSYRLSSFEGLLAESASDTSTLRATFTYKPLGKNIDWSLFVKASPCYVTYLKGSIDRVIDFFEDPNSVSQTIALETAAAFQATLDEVARSAQQQLNEALKNRPRFILDLDIAAPKIVIPSDFQPDGVRSTKLLLDMGYMTLRTEDENLHETEEEIDLYMRFRFGLNELQAFLIDGDFDWKEHYNAAGSSNRLQLSTDNVFLPLLEKCGMVIALQQICVAHPNYPSTRLSVWLPSLGFHFSPARYHRLIQIMKLFQGSDSDDTEKSIYPWCPADFEGEASMLSWKGIGNREAVWQHRYLALVGPFLYILDAPSSTSYKHRSSLIGKQVVVVPPESIVGAQDVLAVCDAGQFDSKVVKSVNALVLRFESENERINWQSKLQGAIYQYSAPAAVAGIVELQQTENGLEGTDTTLDGETTQFNIARKENFFLTGALDELKILLSYKKRGRGDLSDILLATESPLLEFRALGSKVEFVMREYDTSIGAVLQTLEVEDMVCNKASSMCQYLARSDITSTRNTPKKSRKKRISHDGMVFHPKPGTASTGMSMGKTEMNEKFFDTLEDLTESDNPALVGDNEDLTGSISEFHDASDIESDDLLNLRKLPCFQRTPGLLPAVDEIGGNTEHSTGLGNFVTTQVILFSQESPGYRNVDNQVMISLATLSFFCNRPTILGILDLFTSVSTDSDSQEHQSVDEDNFAINLDPEAVQNSEGNSNEKAFFERKDSSVKGLLGRGKSLTVFLLIVNMDRALFVLNREDGAQLATLSQEDLHTEIKVFPSSFGIKAAVGNLRIIDDSLHEGHDYHYICDMRNPGGTSFVELNFLSFNKDDSDYQDFEYSINGKLSEVRLIYLNRFVQEIFSYFMGLIPQDSGYVVKLKDRFTNVEKLFTQSEIEGAPGLKIDLSLTKPIIIMPRATNSKDFLELDILHISLKNNLQWIGGNKDELGAVRLDTMTLQVEDVHMAVGVKGTCGEGIIQEAKGFLLVFKRALRDIWHQVPAADACVKIQELKASLSDREYKVIIDCALSNISEVPNLPPPVFEYNCDNDKHSINMEEEKETAVEDTIVNENSGSTELLWTTIGVSVTMDLVELALFSGRSREAALATLQISGLWFSFRSNSIGESFVMATLDSFSVRDDREGTLTELRYLIGKGDLNCSMVGHSYDFLAKEPNFQLCEDATCSSPVIMLILDAKLSQTLQTVSLRIQQPRLLVAVDFILAITEFFVPTLIGIVSDGYDTEEGPLNIKDGIFLSQICYQQNHREMKFTPNGPLIADNENIDNYIYDGNGGCILLLDRNGKHLDGSSNDHLVFVGDGKKLQFKNVVIQNGQYLDSCVFLGTNSSYTVSENDGVYLEEYPSWTPDSQQVSTISDTDSLKEQHQKTGTPTRMMVDFQAISPELTFYASGRNSAKSRKATERLLRAKMDIFSRLVSEGEDTELNASIHGLAIEAGSGFNVLKPVDTKLKYAAVSGRQSLHVVLSDIFTDFSFSILQLIISLQEDILSFLRITGKQVTIECSEFERIWTDDRKTEVEHVTIWRPHAPSGFGVLGHCVTPLAEPPLQAILAFNLSYNHVKRPLHFRRVWSSNSLQQYGEPIKENDGSSKTLSSAECSIWFPVAPTGYVAFGCVASVGEDPPPLSSVVCVREQLATSSGMKDCIYLRNSLINDVNVNVNFWRVDNSASSFFVVLSSNSLPVRPLEFRHVAISQRPLSDRKSPHGQSTREDAHSVTEEDTFTQDGAGTMRSELACSESVTCFKFVWWDKNSSSSRNISIWRPILPSGCAFLGDIAVDGYEPPGSALVLCNPYDGVLLKKPLFFERKGHIRKLKDLQSIFFWFPVAPPGYTALGCVASLNSKIDPELYDSLCCVRNDLITRTQFSDRLWDSTGLRHCREVFSIWPIENKAHTFIARHGARHPPMRLALKLADYERTTEPDDLVINGEVCKLTATLHDDFGDFMCPLLKLSLSSINLSLHGRVNGMSSTVNFTLEMLTYNGMLSAWESFVEPTNGFVRYENTTDSSTLLNSASSQIRIVSTSNLNINLSTTNINMFLEASSSWGKLSKVKDRGKPAELGQGSIEKCGMSAIDIKHKNTVCIVHCNKLGQEILLRIVDANRQIITLPLSSGALASIELPSSSSILDPNLKEGSQIQCIRHVAVKIGDVHLKYEEGLSYHRYMVAIRVFPQHSLQEQSARTRGLNPLSDFLTGQIIVQWNEVFLFGVVPGETSVAEMVMIDLAKGSSVGYCSFTLTEEETRNRNVQSMDCQSIYSAEMKWQELLQPDGPGIEEQNQQKYQGQISYAICFVSDTQECKTSDGLMWHNLNPKPGTIQISYAGQDSWMDVHLDYTTGVSCGKLGTDTVITEIITTDEKKHVIVRSSVTVFNMTNGFLDIALFPKASYPGAGTSAIEATDSDSLHELSVVDEIFENERYQPLAGWGSSWPGYLLPSDPDHWSKRDGSCSTKDFPEPGLPLGWKWTDNWHVDKTGAADEDGWSYSFDFRTTTWPPKENSKGPFTFARRRRWIRSRCSINTDGSEVVTIGVLEPGGNLSLPVSCLRLNSPEYCLHFRPNKCDTHTHIDYEWSHLVSNNSKSEMNKRHQPLSQVGIHSLFETQLLLCCTRHQQSSSYNESCVWFCLDITANNAGRDASFTPLKDWKIVVFAPLTLFNLLPVSSEYAVLEKCPGLGLIVRDRDIIDSGKEAHIFHADIRRPLYLTWLPQGGWQSEHDAVLISHPHRQLASYVTLQSYHTRRRLHVLIDYSQDRKDMVAKKMQLYAPCWLDVRDCPPLNFQVLEVKQPKVKASNSELNDRTPRIMHSKLAEVNEEINNEEINDSITMVSVFNLENMGLSVSLSAPLNSSFGPVVPLSLLMDMEGITELRAIDQESSTYYKLAVSLRLCPYQSVPTKVIVIRPYMVFINRLGQSIYLKQNSVDQPKTLHTFDYRMSFPISMTDDQERLQLRIDETAWCLPISIKQEESTHIVMHQENGTRKLIRMEIRGNEEGSRFVVIFRHASVHGPYRFENCTKHRVIEFRQAGCNDDSWQSLQPHSTKRFAWDDPYGMQLLEIKMGSVNVSACEKYDINKVGDHIFCNYSTKPAMCIHIEEISVLKIVRFLDILFPDDQESAEGKCLPIGIVNSVMAAQTNKPQVVASTSRLEAIIDLGEFGLSVIDPKPQEIVYLYMERVYAAYSTGYGGNTSRLKLVIGYCQLDNQLQFACTPVLLAPEDKRMLSQPIIKCTVIMADENSESVEVYPYIGIHVSQCPWRLNVHEPIIWAAMQFYNNLHLQYLSGGSDTVHADPEVRIDLIDVSEIRLKLTLEATPWQRPHGVLGIWSPILTTLGNIHRMPIHIRSFSRRHRYMRKSTLFTAILGHVKRDLIHNPLLLLTGVDIIGIASSTFATLSESVAELSGDGKYLQLRSRQDRSRRISGVSDGLLQGTEALAQGVAFGVSGVVTKPMALGKEHGVLGFLQGLGSAVLGFVAQPVSGALDFVALTVNGVSASCSKYLEMFQQKPKLERIRPPLAILSDGILRPYDRKSAMGQVLLQLAEVRRSFCTGNIFKEPSKFAWSDFYENHFDVPGNKVIMITSSRLMLLQCPVSHASDKILEPCSIRWEIPWTNLFALEAAGGANDCSPRYVVFHVRDLPDTFAYTVKCFVDDADDTMTQAKFMQSAIQKAWKTYAPDNKMMLSQISKRHQRRIAPGSTSRRGIVSGKDINDMKNISRNTEYSPGSTSRRGTVSGKEIDDVKNISTNTECSCGPSTFNATVNADSENVGHEEIFLFEEIWTSKRDENVRCYFCTQEDSSSMEVITIWRPLLPDGYVSVGDIARVGTHPPMLTDTYKNEGSRFAAPTGFDLVWRSWKDGFVEPISIWMPRAPDGYVALGCVAVGSYAEPQAGCVWCAHADLVQETHIEQEIWHAPNQSPWGCFIYQVPTQALTFTATRRPLQHGKAKRIVLPEIS